jgi:hypothetical protein
MEQFKIETQDFIQNIINLREASFLSDAHKEKIKLELKFCSVSSGVNCTRIDSYEEYENLVKYIKSNLISTMFTIRIPPFDDTKQYLCI